MKSFMTVILGLMCSVCVSGMAVGGSLDVPGLPSAGSGMYTLSQIYDYLNSGIKATPVPSFQEPSSAPLSTMRTLKEIYEDIEAKLDQSTVSAADVKSGEKFFCTQPGSWGIRTGTLVPPPSPTPTETSTPTPTTTPTSSLYGGLVSYYNFNESSGAVIDSKGTYNGTIVGTIARGVTGKIGNAFSFSAGNVATTVPVSITGNSYTVSLWFETSNVGEMIPVDDSTDNRHQYFRFQSGNGKIEYLSNVTPLAYCNGLD
ncbi:MAG: hypothetical protein NTZ78_14800 [Candidatus Aureabacteria bacterium]|nr:hypothetical protein [Candidatus Auribacterota bacterium]